MTTQYENNHTICKDIEFKFDNDELISPSNWNTYVVFNKAENVVSLIDTPTHQNFGRNSFSVCISDSNNEVTFEKEGFVSAVEGWVNEVTQAPLLTHTIEFSLQEAEVNLKASLEIVCED